MISLKRLATQKVFRCTFLRLSKSSTKGNHGLRFHQFRDFAICNEKRLEFFRPNLITSKYSTDANHGSGGKPTQDSAPNVGKSARQELEEMEEEEDYEDDDGENDSDELDDDEEEDDDDDDNEEELEGSNTQKMFEKIAKGDSEILKQLKLIEFEIALVKEMGVLVPRVIKKQHWEELLKISKSVKKTEYLEFLYINELKERSKKESKKLKKEKALENISKAGFHYYGLCGHTMFYRVYNSSLNRILNHRQYESKLKIIFDCSYQEYMSLRGMKNCAKQIAMTLGDAKYHKVACQFSLCNLDKNDSFGKILPRYLNNSNITYEKSEKSYLDLYQRDKLIYLSPHALHDLTEVNTDNVYIIGSYVDKGYGVKASLAKSKENYVRAAKFPIDFYLAWKEGSKALTLPVVVNILLDMAYYRDWNKAFKNIPSKCYYNNSSRRKLSLLDRDDDLILNLEN